MKKISLFLFFATSILYSQKKKEYYFDENGHKISKDQFIKSIDHSKNIQYYTKNDTAFFAKIAIRKNYGTISPAQLDSIKKFLESESGIKIDPSKRIVINYYSGGEWEVPSKGLSSWNIYHRDYLKKLSKISPVQNFWIYKDDENLRYNYGEKLPWYHDKDSLIEKIFFPYFFRHGSFVIIDSEGNYYSYFGEYGKDTVWNGMKEFITKYGN